MIEMLLEMLGTVEGWIGRFLCRVLHLHGHSCRGRMDHWPLSTVKGRWLRSTGPFWI